MHDIPQLGNQFWREQHTRWRVTLREAGTDVVRIREAAELRHAVQAPGVNATIERESEHMVFAAGQLGEPHVFQRRNGQR